MFSSKIISDSELSGFHEGNSKSKKVEGLLKEQISSWALVKKNYQDLKSVKKKEFYFNTFKIVLQFNFGRITSSSAKVDEKSIKERPCFLCESNLPQEQKGLLCNDKYLLLVNPFPIFSKHFTIPQIAHNPQEILSNFNSMLLIAKELKEDFTLFYNGPQCGASAPDHMHFQASPKNELPVEQEINSLLNSSEIIKTNNSISVYAISNYLRKLFFIESDSFNNVLHEFRKLYDSIQDVNGIDYEPMLNIIVTYNEAWRVFIFPRKAHRAKEFFLEGNNKILLSPASVDFGGLLVTPSEEDFEKIDAKYIESLFKQTTIDENTFNEIIVKYKRNNN